MDAATHDRDDAPPTRFLGDPRLTVALMLADGAVWLYVGVAASSSM